MFSCLQLKHDTLLTWLSKQETVFERNAFSQSAFEMMPWKVPYWRDNKASIWIFSILDWGGAENKIYPKQYFWTLYISYVCVKRKKKNRTGPVKQFAHQMKFLTIFFLMLYLISFSLSQLSVLLHFAGRIHTAVNHTDHLFFLPPVIYSIFLFI